MCEVTMTIPEHSLLALDLAPEQVGDELRLAAAIKLYEVGRLSSGAAAELAGVPRVLFLQRLGDYGVATFRQSEAELREELITENDRPVAQLSALSAETPQPVLGRCQEMLTIIAEDDEHLADWNEYLP